ncbi:hypothetical protein LJY25_00630 [Hymenobacter sp. BT175]|uniref:hypothetical protein n=1 Tax=Hymenobacter translucens TaxID=2886507 RepID=UPI001D0DEFA0|nr:hypothetical protein [Hymenobacter translucens]MCC2544933.1 hypothetical protein [Hymenobacter translucens]
MFVRRLTVSILGSILLSACGHALTEVPGFDAKAWRQDPFACRNQRAAQLSALRENRELLYGARNRDINTLLGHPDEDELSEQNERVYSYYVEPGPQCGPGHPRSAVNKFTVRFSPLSTVTEVGFEKPIR